MTKKKIITGISLILLISVGLFFYLSVKKDLPRNTDKHQEDTLNWVATKIGSLHIKTFKGDSLNNSPNLVFVIHGDAPFNKPGYQYRMAKKISSANKNTIAVGVLRPGYTDVEEQTSNGVKGLTTGDNYTLENIDAIAEAITKLKSIYRPAKTVIVGHSGGSALAADIISLYPGISTTAVLVSCPCNVPNFRKHMKETQNDPLWNEPVESISPLDVADKIAKETQVVLMIGEKDDITPIELSRQYNEKLKSLNRNVKLISIPNEGHEILLSKPVMKAIAEVLR
ncbi:MAG: prolyl oligopeptidase family serine peptidase [Bacteroidetes bacterium]|nr:prolyl oligopeptidase family serine peptidase [Bacteroidota bacterium]